MRVVEGKAFDVGADADWFADAFQIPREAVREAAGSISSVSLIGRKPAV